MFQKLRQFILEHCQDQQWVTKAELYHACDTRLSPEFFRRWFEMKERRPETALSFRASVVSNTVRDLVRSKCFEREWIDEPNIAGSRWKIRMTAKGRAALERLLVAA